MGISSVTKEEILDVFREIRKEPTPKRINHLYDLMIINLGIGRATAIEVMADTYDLSKFQVIEKLKQNGCTYV